MTYTASCLVPVSNVWLNVNSKWSRELLMTPGAVSTGTSKVILRSSRVYMHMGRRVGRRRQNTEMLWLDMSGGGAVGTRWLGEEYQEQRRVCCC